MYNKEFQIIDTEEKAYFIGQAFGDGCNQYSPKYKFVLASTDDDIDLYNKLHKIFPFFKLKRYNSHINMIYLESYTKDISIDLKNLGLTQNKTKQDKNNNFNIPKMPDNLLHHFIRGFFDADGSVYTPSSRYRSRNNVRVEFGMATKNFCKQLMTILDSLDIKYSYYERTKKAGNGKYYMSYIILLTARQESLKFANYIYKDATIFLNRKKEIFYNYIKSEIQIKRDSYPKCSICGKTPTSSGSRDNKQRLLCKNCNHRFTVLLPIN